MMLEWDDILLARARKLAGDVIAQSGLECERPAIERGEWDGDDHVIIAMRATMQTAAAEDLLRECLAVLNGMPRRGINSAEYPDTYKLAAAIDRHFEEVTNA